VQAAMVTAGGRGSQVMKAYPSSWSTSYAGSVVKTSGDFGHAFVATQRAPGTYADILAGKYDTAIDAWFNSIPVSETAYTLFENEPDNSATAKADPTTWAKACAYVINRGAPIMRARGVKGGIGSVLMDYYFRLNRVPYFNTWNYLQYVTPVNLPQTVFCLDSYSKYLDAAATTYESVPGTTKAVFDLARVAGCTRYGIGEFANSLEQRNAGGLIVGTRTTQEAWVRTEIPKIRAIDGLEFAIYFHKPTGAESKNAQLLDALPAIPFTAYANLI